MTDPLAGRDGTHALDGADALAPLPRPAGDDAGLPGGASVGLPGLPTPPLTADPAVVGRWMDGDAAESRRRTDPGAATPGAAEVVRRDPPVRDAGPVRVLPRDEPSPSPGPRTPAPPSGAVVERGEDGGPTPRPRGDDGPEPEWLRERREEHEFHSQFGEWRTGAGPTTGPPKGLRPLTLLVLLALLVLVAAIALA